jgi:hypothetical protein
VLEDGPSRRSRPIDRYVKRRAQAEAATEFGLVADLDTVMADESNHRDELRLARWP